MITNHHISYHTLPESATTASGLHYRPDLDGLRAIAVIAIFTFHINPAWLPGGFLGVDLYFVLSGYLISSNLYNKFDNGNFSFTDFYKRRIKRLLPAFFLILFIGLSFCRILTLPSFSQASAVTARAASLFLSNINLARSTDYFAIEVTNKPFLHLWSLSTEEQFYFLFPLYIFFCYRFSLLRRHFTTILLLTGITLFLCSLVHPSWLSGVDRYYLPHLRFIEIYIGCLLGWLLHRNLLRKGTTKTMRLTAFVSLFFVAFNLIYTNLISGQYFPGIASLLFCIPVASLIYADSSTHCIQRFFSLPPLIWLGKLSYSLYLWHWLFLSFYRYFHGEAPLTTIPIIVIISLSFLFAILSYYAIECPIRYSRLNFQQSLLYLYIIPTALTITYVNHHINDTTLYHLPTKYTSFDHLHQYNYNTLSRKSIIGDTLQSPKILIAGDSQTGMLCHFFDEVLRHEHRSAIFTSCSSNPFLFDYHCGDRFSAKDFPRNRNLYIESIYHQYPTIILANSWGDAEYHADSTFLPALHRTLARLTKEGHKVILIDALYHTSCQPIRHYYLLQQGIQLPTWLEPSKATYRPDYVRRAKKIHTLSMAYKGVEWINLRPIQDSLLHQHLPIMMDEGHYNDYGALLVAKSFIHNKQP